MNRNPNNALPAVIARDYEIHDTLSRCLELPDIPAGQRDEEDQSVTTTKIKRRSSNNRTIPIHHEFTKAFAARSSGELE